jgi:hypothetical protein
LDTDENFTRASHRTARFIRWLQVSLYAIEPLSKSIAKLKRVWLINNHELFHTDQITHGDRQVWGLGVGGF